jgi:hypothetical protein
MHELELAKQLSNDELISALTRCVREGHEVNARLIAHLGEVDARGLFRDQGFSSMFDYTVRALHMSESAADLRIKAARIGRKFPIALEMLANGELHMTALRLLAPVLTPANVGLLSEACFMSKLQVKELIAKHFPRPDVPELVRRLPQPRPPAESLQSQSPTSLLPAIGDASPLAGEAATGHLANFLEETSTRANEQYLDLLGSAEPNVECKAAATFGAQPASPQSAQNLEVDRLLRTTHRRGVTEPLSGGRYKVQFTASQALHDKLNEARDLLHDQIPNGEIAAIVELALDLLITQKKNRRFAQMARPRKQRAANSEPAAAATTRDEKQVPEGTWTGDNTLVHGPAAESSPNRKRPQPDARYIPRALRREVYARDGGQCSFLSENGTRCCSRRNLEFHHIAPFARGGASSVKNLSLMCRAHNALLAERDYGRDFMKRRVGARASEPKHQGTAERSLNRVQTRA